MRNRVSCNKVARAPFFHFSPKYRLESLHEHFYYFIQLRSAKEDSNTKTYTKKQKHDHEEFTQRYFTWPHSHGTTETETALSARYV